MDAFWNFMNSTGFFLTAFGAYIGYLSYRSGKETAALIDAGNARLQASLDSIQKGREEADARLQANLASNEKYREEADARLQVNLAAIEKSREEANRRMEITLENNQKRWEQSDEFNKRMLDKILDRVA
jgi:F0F1-type ATP synthase membrane subunit b/b'